MWQRPAMKDVSMLFLYLEGKDLKIYSYTALLSAESLSISHFTLTGLVYIIC